MNIHPVHYAPHHTGHLPLCGVRHTSHGGEHQLVMCTMDRDEITCFKCIDQYTERAMTPEQVEALNQVRSDIDALFEELEQQVAFDHLKHVTLHVIEHMIEDTPWWNLRRRFQLRRAQISTAAMRLEDVK
jgi:hypothetical protein